VVHEYVAFHAAGRTQRVTREEYDNWHWRFTHLYNGVVLFGTDEARNAAANLRVVLAAIDERYRKGSQPVQRPRSPTCSKAHT
jgi:hypothetical protein